MSGWTQQDWVAHQDEDGAWHVFSGSYNVAAIAAFSFGERPHDEEANAHLIAAAPDLYAALDWLCRALVHDHNKNIDYWTEALAALAKARGES